MILLFLSPHFFASEQCYEVEKALAKMDAGEARVFAIRIGPYDWEILPSERLRTLPSNGTPVANWPNRDDAWVEIAREIRLAITEIQSPRSRDVPKGPSLAKRSSYARNLALSAAWFGGIGLSLCLSFDLGLIKFETNFHGALVQFTTASAVLCGALSAWLGIGCLYRREGLGVLVWWVIAPVMAVAELATLTSVLRLLHAGYFSALHTIILAAVLGSVAPGLLTAAALGHDFMRRTPITSR
jgi:hypothetical protein